MDHDPTGAGDDRALPDGLDICEDCGEARGRTPAGWLSSLLLLGHRLQLVRAALPPAHHRTTGRCRTGSGSTSRGSASGAAAARPRRTATRGRSSPTCRKRTMARRRQERGGDEPDRHDRQPGRRHRPHRRPRASRAAPRARCGRSVVGCLHHPRLPPRPLSREVAGLGRLRAAVHLQGPRAATTTTARPDFAPRRTSSPSACRYEGPALPQHVVDMDGKPLGPAMVAVQDANGDWRLVSAGGGPDD